MDETRFDRLARLEKRLERRKRIAKLHLRRLRDRQNPLDFYNTKEFKKRFHMHKETALFVVKLIQVDLCVPVKRGTHIPILTKFLIVLRFFSTGSFQLVVGDLNTVCQATVSNLVKQVSRALAKHCKKFIRFPTHEEAPDVREKFYKLAKFPGVIGAVDGCLIKIKSPGGNNAELFRCRKGYFSLNVQGVCDSDLNFTNLVVRWYGSAHDSRVFENSLLCSNIENGRSPGILLGDSGYPWLPYLMPPLDLPVTIPEKRYQRAQLSTRNIIERTFGVWKRRFPCLNDLRTKLSTTQLIIVAVGVLHNISRSHNDIFENDYYDHPPPEESTPYPSSNLLAGRAAQRSIIQSHFS